ncbi:MAG TPA: molybdenum cofactor guanylyltransferase [Gaiellaceae bacterium]|nr:molybdenum cofactor guanylyltransferase [Gaiellaceae bacterium]
MADRGLTGVLLVGGASRRFGSPKALAEWQGETLAARAWRTLGEACDERLAVGKAADGLELGFPLLDDGTPLRHPAAGIVAGLRSAAHEVCVVLPVDCPLVTAASLRALGAACAAAAVASGGAPLPAAVRRSTLPVWERVLAAEASLRAALAELEVATVELDPAELLGVNTVDDLRGLR